VSSEIESSASGTSEPLERLGAANKRRRDSLYEDHRDEHYAANRGHLVRQAPVRWALGQDPNDDEAQAGSGWDYLKLDGTEQEAAKPVSPFEGRTGAPSGIRCFTCHQQDFLVMDERTAEESIAGDVELTWAAKNNRPLDEYRASNKYMLFCPGCKAVAQVIDQVLRMLQMGQAVGVHH
jgi:hypothetical protein